MPFLQVSHFARRSSILAAVFPRPNLWTQLAWRLAPVKREGLACSGFEGVAASLPAEVQTFVSDSYPHNHTYSPLDDRLVPDRKLAFRVAGLSRFYSPPLRR